MKNHISTSFVVDVVTQLPVGEHSIVATVCEQTSARPASVPGMVRMNGDSLSLMYIATEITTPMGKIQ